MIIDISRTILNMAASEKTYKEAKSDMAHLLCDIALQSDADIEAMYKLASRKIGITYPKNYLNAIFSYAKWCKDNNASYQDALDKLNSSRGLREYYNLPATVLDSDWIALFNSDAP